MFKRKPAPHLLTNKQMNTNTQSHHLDRIQALKSFHDSNELIIEGRVITLNPDRLIKKIKESQNLIRKAQDNPESSKWALFEAERLLNEIAYRLS